MHPPLLTRVVGKFRGMKSDYRGRAKQAHVPAGKRALQLLKASVTARAFSSPLKPAYWTPKTGG